MPNELEALQRALKDERRIIAAICLDDTRGQVRVSARSLALVDDDTAISTLQNADGSITISVKPRA